MRVGSELLSEKVTSLLSHSLRLPASKFSCMHASLQSAHGTHTPGGLNGDRYLEMVRMTVSVVDDPQAVDVLDGPQLYIRPTFSFPYLPL